MSIAYFWQFSAVQEIPLYGSIDRRERVGFTRSYGMEKGDSGRPAVDKAALSPYVHC